MTRLIFGGKKYSLAIRQRPLVVAVALALHIGTVTGAVITVDAHIPPGCTLTDAVVSANNDVSVGGCVSGLGDDVILFDPALSGSTITPGVQLDIASNMTIDGDSAITVSGGGSQRVFRVLPGTDVILAGLIIRDGSREGPYESGSAIYNSGNLTVLDSLIKDNTANSRGAVLNENGNLTIRDSILSGNVSAYGGAVYSNNTAAIYASVLSGNTGGGGGAIQNTGTLALEDSVIRDNSANVGGGIDNLGGTLTVSNSLISGNLAADAGGGIINRSDFVSHGELTIENSTLSQNSQASPTGGWGGGAIRTDDYAVTVARNCTIVGNSASTGSTSAGGGFSTTTEGTTNVINTVVAGNTEKDCYGGVDINTNNWFGDFSCDGVAAGYPGLGTLEDNGGVTWTHLPLSGSGLIDIGDPVSCTTNDQRGAARPRDGDGDDTAECDIGAVEVGYYSDTCAIGPVTMPAGSYRGIHTHRSETTLATREFTWFSTDLDILLEASQSITLTNELTIEDNVEFSARIKDVSCTPAF